VNWELDFKRCLEKRWLVSMPEARFLVTKELKAAHDDLIEADTSYQRGGYKVEHHPDLLCDVPRRASFAIQPGAP
jgi:hypothetical protein